MKVSSDCVVFKANQARHASDLQFSCPWNSPQSGSISFSGCRTCRRPGGAGVNCGEAVAAPMGKRPMSVQLLLGGLMLGTRNPDVDKAGNLNAGGEHCSKLNLWMTFSCPGA